MSHSILVRQYLSLLDHSIASSTLLFSVTISIARVNSEDLAIFQYDSIKI